MLIVEDLPEKAEEISLEIIANFPNIKIIRKTSYHSVFVFITIEQPKLIRNIRV